MTAGPRALAHARPWALAIAAVVVSPLVALIAHAAGGDGEHWAHLATYVLPDAAISTLILLAGVGLLVVVLGTGSAWLVTAYTFPGRGVLSWALLLPLAVPTYIVAFAYLDLLHPIGPLQSGLRALLGYDSPRQLRLPDARSMVGAIFVLGVVLYPYVYLTTRAMFATQAAGLIEAARTLGATRREVFFRVALPLARPAIAVGLGLALLETLNDVGASELMGVQTLTVSVYTTWVTRSDLAGAAQIALAMLAVVVALVLLERHGRRRQRYASVRPRAMQPRRLGGASGLLALSLGATPVVLGFAAPAAYLAGEAAERIHRVRGVSDQLLASLGNTLVVAVLATVVTVACGLVVAWAGRGSSKAGGVAVVSLGYAMPGTVLAIGLLGPLSWIDGALAAVGREGAWLMGSLGALVVAYAVRFLAISAGGIAAGLTRIPPSLEQASRLLGETAAGTFRRVHGPLLRPAIAASALLVFVDTMKELPATLLLRPLGFDTLATWLYAEAARGTYEEGAVAALAIVVAGLLPVIWLARSEPTVGAER